MNNGCHGNAKGIQFVIWTKGQIWNPEGHHFYRYLWYIIFRCPFWVPIFSCPFLSVNFQMSIFRCPFSDVHLNTNKKTMDTFSTLSTSSPFAKTFLTVLPKKQKAPYSIYCNIDLVTLKNVNSFKGSSLHSFSRLLLEYARVPYQIWAPLRLPVLTWLINLFSSSPAGRPGRDW